MFHKSYCLLVVSIVLSGCSRSTSPCPAFLQVQQTIAERTGKSIQWNRHSSEACELRDTVDALLQEDLTVDRAVHIALLNSPRLQASYESLGIAQAQLVQAGLLKNPILTVSLRYGEGYIIETPFLQNFLDILLKPLKTKMACADLEAVKMRVAGDVIDLIADTKIAFYSLQSLQEELIMSRQILEVRETSYEFAKRLRQSGNTVLLDLLTEQSLYEHAKISVASLELSVENARNHLSSLMGVWGAQVNWNMWGYLPNTPIESIDVSDVENCAIANNLDLQVLRKKMQALSALIGIETAQTIFPEIGLGVDTEREPDGLWYFGPLFSSAIPLFDFGQAQRAQGRAELCQLWNDYTGLAIDIRSTTRSACFDVLNAHRQSRYYAEVLVPLDENVTRVTLTRCNAMQLGVFDLLWAKQREVETKQQEVLQRRDYWIASTELERILSGRVNFRRLLDRPLNLRGMPDGKMGL